MPFNQSEQKTVILDNQELFYKRLRWDILTLLAPLVLLLDIQIMQDQSEKHFVLSCSAFFTLLVGLRLAIGIKGRRKSFRTPQRYKYAVLVLGLQNFMVSGAFVYVYKLRGPGDSNTALLLAILIGLGAYVLFSFQLSKRFQLFQIFCMCFPLFTMPYFVPTLESWSFLGAVSIVALYFFKTMRLNGHILMNIEDKGRVLEELNRLQAKGKNIHADRLVFLGEMASGIAHEINNPLTVITGRAEITQRKLSNGQLKLEEIPPIFEIILIQAKRAAQIVSSLKKFASVKSDEKMRNESLNMMMAESLDLCLEKFKKVGIKIHVELEYQGLIECRANEMTQVILSLMNNAYEELISKKCGDIFIKSQRIGDWIELSISDNGKGIPSDQMQNVFMPFFSTKADNKGIGLGLAVSKGVVESHSGELVYERIDGKSHFILILPASQQAVKSEIPEHFQERIRRFEEILRQYEWRVPVTE